MDEKRKNPYIIKAFALMLSAFFVGSLFTGVRAYADASTSQKPEDAPSSLARPAAKTSPSSAPASHSQAPTSPYKMQAKRGGGVVSKGYYSSGSSNKPYSPFATSLSQNPPSTPAPSSQSSIPTSFGSGWTSEILTFTANNLLNASDPANADSPSVTSQAVISFLEGKGITVATAAQTQITNEVNSLMDTYNDHPSLSDGAPLARIFAIQIICMKNTSTGQLVYPEAFPEDMLDKSYSAQYQSSWNAATNGKSYLLDATYIYNSIAYTASNVIWEDPAINESGVYSLDQIEQNQLKSMTAETGKINSLNLIGITQRAYAIKTNPPSMNISKGYEEETGNNNDWSSPYVDITQSDVVSPGSSATVDFSVETGTSDTNALSATMTLSGAPNAQIDKSSFKESGLWWVTASDFQVTLSNNNRTATIKYIDPSLLNPNTTFTFSFNVDVTSPASYMAEVCSVAEGEVVSDNSTLTLNGSSRTWCFPISSLSESQPTPSTLSSSSPTSQVTIEAPGWIFQYGNPVTDTFWSSLNGAATSLAQYQQFQPTLPNLDKYTVDCSNLSVKDLTTGQDVTSLFTSSYTQASSYDTGLPYINGSTYGGYSLNPGVLKVSWNGTWPTQSSSSSPIGFNLFEVTFPLTLKSSAGGSIYSQAGPAILSSSVHESPTPAPAGLTNPAPLQPENAGELEKGKIESSNLTATLGVQMPFEVQAQFPDSGQISAMSSSSLNLTFYIYDSTASVDLKSVEVNGLAYKSLPSSTDSSNNGITLIPFNSADLNYLKNHASSSSNLDITFNWAISSAPSYATVEIGYLPASSLNASSVPVFTSLSSAKTLTIYTNGIASLTPNANQSSAITGIWFQNEYLQGGYARGAEFSVQNSQGQYLTPSSTGKPPYSFSSTPYYFKSINGEGMFKIWGLADGTYTVTQTKLPNYGTAPKTSFTVTLDYFSQKPSLISSPSPASLIDESAFIIYNRGGGDLPYTGGNSRIVFLCALLPVILSLAAFVSYKIYKSRSKAPRH